MRKVWQSIGILALATLLCACKFNGDHTAQGYVEGRFTYVTSEIGGKLEQIDVNRGDPIKKDAALFTLEKDPQASKYHQAQADLRQAKADLINLQKAKRPTEIAAIKAQIDQVKPELAYTTKMVKRYKHLSTKGYIQIEALDKMVSNEINLQNKLAELEENLKTSELSIGRDDQIKAAQAKVKAAQAAVSQYKWQVEQKTITSPVTGLVFDTYYRIGEAIAANQPVVSIIAPENVYTVFFIPETALSRVKLGQDVKITFDGGTKPMNAKISFISPEAEYAPPVVYSEKTRVKLMYRIEARTALNEALNLHPGQPVTVSYGQ